VKNTSYEVHHYVIFSTTRLPPFLGPNGYWFLFTKILQTGNLSKYNMSVAPFHFVYEPQWNALHSLQIVVYILIASKRCHISAIQS